MVPGGPYKKIHGPYTVPNGPYKNTLAEKSFGVYLMCIYVWGPTHPGLCEFDYLVQCTTSFEPYSQELRSNSCWAQDHTSRTTKYCPKKRSSHQQT